MRDLITTPASWIELVALVLVSFIFLGSGITHFTNTAFYVSIVPPFIPRPLFVVYLTAIIELVLLALLWCAATRYYAALALIGFLIMVYPANIYMAMYPEKFPQYSTLALYGRLALQFVFIYLCWFVRGPAPS